MRILKEYTSDGNTDIIVKDFNSLNTTIGLKFELNHGSTNINSANCYLELVNSESEVIAKTIAYLPVATDGVINLADDATKGVVEGYVQSIYPVEAAISQMRFQFNKADAGEDAEGTYKVYVLAI